MARLQSKGNNTITASERDHEWMSHALRLAERAQAQGEVPVGAVIVRDNSLIGEGWNQPIASNDPSAHAEIIALRNAAQNEKNYRLPETTMYVTLEPCAMCAGAIIHARVKRVVFGTADPGGGAAVSVFAILGTDKLNHKVKVTGDVMQQECAIILKEFFRNKR